jgi:hypothetical protein
MYTNAEAALSKLEASLHDSEVDKLAGKALSPKSGDLTGRSTDDPSPHDLVKLTMFFPVFPTRCAELSSEASTPCATDTQQAAPIKAMNADERAAGNAPANPRAARQQVP